MCSVMTSLAATTHLAGDDKGSDREEEEEEEEEDAAAPEPAQEEAKPLDFTSKPSPSENAPPTAAGSGKKRIAGFSIDDILSHKTAAIKEKQQQKKPRQDEDDEDEDFDEDDEDEEEDDDDRRCSSGGIVRPWDRNAAGKAGDGEGGDRRKSVGDASPLDALFQMASKTFEGLKAKSELDHAHLSFSSKQPSKKKRKSRTAFTNHQIFELEKRFLYQKYLSPADRDEIAAHLGLTNAQVITWFQNRRAKLKRDMEELRKDVECTSSVLPHAVVAAAAAGGSRPGQMVAAVHAALASRNFAAAAAAAGPPGSMLKFPPLGFPPPQSVSGAHILMSSPPGGFPGLPPHPSLSELSAHPTSTLSMSMSMSQQNSPASRSDSGGCGRRSMSPQIRVTDSDG